MRSAVIAVKKFAILCHRWMGVAFCVLFMWWFISGIFMMYWGYPEVTERDRLERAPVLEAARVKLGPEEAYRAAGFDDAPGAVRLSSFDGRPAYFFRVGRGSAIVYADTGEQQDVFPQELNLRTAATWAGQPESAARLDTVEEPDQWTLLGGVRRQLPLLKYTFPDGQQVYLNEDTGEVVQHTTLSSRIYAHLGAIPHWLYYTPLRLQQDLWTNVVVWSSGIATIAALLGMIVGIWMWAPKQKKYRFDGQPTGIPYTGQKRLHTILGLTFGILTMTWAFSGMLSMDPFPVTSGGPVGGRGEAGKGKAAPAQRVQQALGGRFDLATFEGRHPQEVLAQLDSTFAVKELEWASFTGQPVFHAKNAAGDVRVLAATAAAADQLYAETVLRAVREAAGDENLAELRVLTQYDRYYLDRTRQRPLPVIYAKLNDANETRLYIDPNTARVVGRYANTTSAWVNRWLYHGLHSLDFPWLYNYRPAWDIVVLGLMLACTWLCWTSIVLSWRVVKRKFAARRVPNEDLPAAS